MCFFVFLGGSKGGSRGLPPSPNFAIIFIGISPVIYYRIFVVFCNLLLPPPPLDFLDLPLVLDFACLFLFVGGFGLFFVCWAFLVGFGVFFYF